MSDRTHSLIISQQLLGAVQESSVSIPGKFVQPTQLVWLALNVLMTLLKSDAMAALLQHEWPGLVPVLLRECDRAGQHVWMVMGCLRTLLQCLTSRVSSQPNLDKYISGQAVSSTFINVDSNRQCSCFH